MRLAAVLLLLLAVGCVRQHPRPCSDNFDDDRPECNIRDECPCQFPWMPWFDVCCLTQAVEALR
jgi:hypothetical protein